MLFKQMLSSDCYLQVSKDFKVMLTDGEYIHSECMGRGLLEAISIGMPVIATDSGAISEIINQQRGELIKSGDLQELTSALSNFISTPKAFRNPTNEYSWANYFSLYETLWLSNEKVSACN